MYENCTLIIEKRYFSISISDLKKFRKFLDLLSNSDPNGVEKVLIDLLENKLDLAELDIEPSALSDKYLDENKYPTTTKIEISELEIEEEIGVVVFNVKYIFDNFECDFDNYGNNPRNLFDNEALSIYTLQVKDEILKEYGARNLSYYEPETKVFLKND